MSLVLSCKSASSPFLTPLSASVNVHDRNVLVLRYFLTNSFSLELL